MPVFSSIWIPPVPVVIFVCIEKWVGLSNTLWNRIRPFFNGCKRSNTPTVHIRLAKVLHDVRPSREAKVFKVKSAFRFGSVALPKDFGIVCVFVWELWLMFCICLVRELWFSAVFDYQFFTLVIARWRGTERDELFSPSRHRWYMVIISSLYKFIQD